MKSNHDMLVSVEKGFSRYIKSCLFHASRDFFKKYDQEVRRTKPFDEYADGVHLTIHVCTTPSAYVEAQECLSQAIHTLTPMEKKLLYLKFDLEKTDREIAQSFGVTRQAVTKSKLLLLDKLKNLLDS